MSAELHYFDLSGFKIVGRGGVARLFCETNGVPYTDKSVEFGEFGKGQKQHLIDSSENPSGSLPVLYDGDFSLSETNAIIRYLARKHSVQQDAKTEAVSDMLTDKVVPLRDETITALLSGDDAVKAKHKEDRKKHYHILEQLIQKHANPSGLISQTDKPTAGDLAVFCIAYDDAQLFGKPEGDYPALKKLTDNLSQNAAITQWLEKHNYGANPLH